MDEAWEKELAALVGAARRVVVLAVGNPDKADDGVGPAVAERLLARSAGRSGEGRPKPFLVVDGRETPESRTGEIRRFEPDLTLIVDATVGGRPPGTIFIVDRDKIADEGVSTHTISLLYLVRYLEESIGSRVTVLGVEPRRLDLEAGLAPEVEKAAADVASALSRWLVE
jgi:hydrogenase 3 maturation protease